MSKSGKRAHATAVIWPGKLSKEISSSLKYFDELMISLKWSMEGKRLWNK